MNFTTAVNYKKPFKYLVDSMSKYKFCYIVWRITNQQLANEVWLVFVVKKSWQYDGQEI